MTGQITFAAYNLAQANILWPSVLWSTIFATVNASKIWSIFHERTAEVHMSPEQEQVFVDFFMDHGVTPIQFSWIEEKATHLKVKKGKILIHKGDLVDRIFLVVRGSTHAHVWGRKLEAVSASSPNRGDQLAGGDSGSWIGEMAFLDWFQRRHEEIDPNLPKEQHSRFGRGVSMYTIIADEDCEILAWSHEAMEELMEKSNDLRAALTRAMTAEVVAKVVNLTIERSNQRSWTSWLRYWRHKDGSQVVNLEPNP